MLLRIGIPKGSLFESTRRLFKNAGYTITLAERSYVPAIDDPEIGGRDPGAEMGRYVGEQHTRHGDNRPRLGAGAELQSGGGRRLRYGKVGFRGVKWVVAVPVDSKIKDLPGLQGKKIATELVGFTTRYLKSHKIDAVVEYSWGATEAKPPLLADAIVEVTETGASLAANNLRIIETILESETVVIANKSCV